MAFDLSEYKAQTKQFTSRTGKIRRGFGGFGLEYLLFKAPRVAWLLFYRPRMQKDYDFATPLLPVPSHLQQRSVERCRVFANRDEMLRILSKRKIWAEVGTLEGEFARKILDICEPEHLDLMDLR